MTEPIKAALTREQWIELRRGRGVRVPDESGDVGIAYCHSVDKNASQAGSNNVRSICPRRCTPS